MSEKLKLAERTASDIDRLRDGYRPAARRGAILFFVLSEMALVNTMYQYSLSAFLEVFGLSLKKSLPDSILVKRLRNIMDTLTFNIYNYGCTGEHLFPPPGTDVTWAGVPGVVPKLIPLVGTSVRGSQGPPSRPPFSFVTSLQAPCPKSQSEVLGLRASV